MRGGLAARTLLRRQPALLLGVVLAALMLYVAALPGTLTVHSPTAVDVNAALQPPSVAHLFGTDDTGRDLYARVLYGARITLGIVAGSLALAAVAGGALGLLAGFFGRVSDMAASRLVDVALSFPPIFLGVVITGILGPGVRNLVLAMAIVYAPVFFRIARAGAIAEGARTYIEAARALGLGEWTILRRHVARNVWPLIFLQYMILFPLALQIEAALGFLGLGVQPPTPDWGSILAQAKDLLLTAPWMSIFPGAFILIAAAAVILIGRSLQPILDAPG
ncbi:MAG: ABC transporter permease [Alphaproteobacteria bacterium]|nr:ABC transporter permease [Alphaproteobacteria bacterium]